MTIGSKISKSIKYKAETEGKKSLNSKKSKMDNIIKANRFITHKESTIMCTLNKRSVWSKSIFMSNPLIINFRF